MPHTNSAKKRLRQSEKRREQNRAYRTRYRRLVKRSRELIAAGDAAAAESAVSAASQALDRVAGKGVIHRGQAARIKSRLAVQLNALKGRPVAAEAD